MTTIAEEAKTEREKRRRSGIHKARRNGWLEYLDAEYPSSITWVDSLPEVLARRPQVLSPNALGGAISESLVDDLASAGVRLVCGGANNQLATERAGDLLDHADIVYAPDFCVNCGGVIQVAEELTGADLDRARATVERVFDTTRSVLERARGEGITPVRAAEREAEARIGASLLPGGPLTRATPGTR